MPHLNMTKLQQNQQVKKQTGIVMLITLISLVIMLLASIALIRSTDTNLLVSGHLSFKRDIVNQVERAIPVIKQLFASTPTAGPLATASSRESDKSGINYFATVQASNAYGIPNALLNKTPAVFDNNNAIITNAASNVEIHYMIDRMCLAAGAANATACSTSNTTSPCPPKQLCPPETDTPIYRISIRAIGPHNTEAYIQSTFTVQ
jgi:type IV pilus assembly protein PilX